MGILVKKMYVSNFKSIASQLIVLNDINIFFGKNNSGKTNILKSLHLGMTYETINSEDVYNSKIAPFTNDKKVIIDVYIEPQADEKRVSNFDDDWALIFGTGVSVDENGDQFFAFRTEIAYDDNRNVYSNVKKQIKVWKDDGSSTCSSTFNSRIFDNLQSIYIDAHRDISEDLKDRKSFWSKLVSKVKIDESKKAEIQKKLQDINISIKKESELIRAIEEELKKTVSDERFDINISPVTKDLETLYKGIDIYYSNNDFNPVPVSNLGSGIRSWAVFSTIKSQINLVSSLIKPFHSILLVEEPEAHIHPQAQMQLVNMISETNTQKIIATHSPYVINQFPIENLVRVDKNKSGTFISPLLTAIPKEDISVISRSCMKNKSDIVFSKVVVLVEGLTELLAMPIYFKYFFDRFPFEEGVTFVSSDGGGNYKPFFQLLNAFNLDWILFSDGEEKILNKIKKDLREVFNNPNFELYEDDRIIKLDNNQNYEQYLFLNGYGKQVNAVIDSFEEKVNYIKTIYVSSSQWIQHKNPKDKPALIFENRKKEIEECTIYYLKKKKVLLAELIAEEIVKSCATKDKLPKKILELLKKIRRDYSINVYANKKTTRNS